MAGAAAVAPRSSLLRYAGEHATRVGLRGATMLARPAASRHDAGRRPRRAARHEPRAVQDGRSTASRTGVFQGKIIVEPVAQKTDGKMKPRRCSCSDDGARCTTSRSSRSSPTTWTAAMARPAAQLDERPAVLPVAARHPAPRPKLLVQAFLGEAIESLPRGRRAALIERGRGLARQRRRLIVGRPSSGPSPGHPDEAQSSRLPLWKVSTGTRHPIVIRRSTARLGLAGASSRDGSAIPKGGLNHERTRAQPYDVEAIRPISRSCRRQVYGKPLVYLDNAASAQKPQRGDRRAWSTPMRDEYANVHRGLHFLANAATEAYEGARETVRRFLNAPSTDEIIFTRSATEAINLVARLLRRGSRSGRATRSCSRSWSTIPTSCPGTSCASATAR